MTDSTGDRSFPVCASEITVDWLNGVLREAGAPRDHGLAPVEVDPTDKDVAR
jgi:hypothetical protein